MVGQESGGFNQILEKTHHLFIANIKEEDTKLKQLIYFVNGTISLKMIIDTVDSPAPISLLFLQTLIVQS